MPPSGASHNRAAPDSADQLAPCRSRKLLKPLTLEKLLSHDHDLPRYAEAAPYESRSAVAGEDAGVPLLFDRVKKLLAGEHPPLESSTQGQSVCLWTALSSSTQSMLSKKPLMS